MRTFTGEFERKLIAAVSKGLPLVRRPYEAIAKEIGVSEADVIAGLECLIQRGDVKRFGVVVRHRELGYKANGMVVWDIPDERVAELGHCIGKYDFVTLSYQRPRRPGWRYNLFTMVHGQSRENVISQVEFIVEQCGLEGIEHEILFSRRRFKQHGARYHAALNTTDRKQPGASSQEALI